MMANTRNVIKILVQIREWFAGDKAIVSVEDAVLQAASSGLAGKWSNEDLISAVRMLNRERGYDV